MGKQAINNGRVTRICRTILMALLMTAVFLTAAAWMGPSAHAAQDPSTTASEYYMEAPGGSISVLDVDTDKYLFLPNEVDTEHITLASTQANRYVRFSVNGKENNVLNLNDIEPSDYKYVVKVVVRGLLGLRKTSFNLTIMKGSGIGSVYYYSDDPSNQGRAYVEQSKGNKSTGRAMVYDAAGKNLTKDEKNQTITDFHGRGNSSWSDPKKGYQMKFDKKISLVDGTGKEKKWVLLAQYKDPLRLSDKIAKDIAFAGSSKFSPRETWVNFYYDGQYRGLYLLSEKNEIKENRVNIHDMEDDYEAQDPNYGDKVDVKETTNAYGNKYWYQDGLTGPEQLGGFLLEMNALNIDEHNGFNFTVGSSQRAANLKSPDLASNEAVKYISEYFQEFCNAITTKDDSGKRTGRNPQTGLFYYDYCDLDSLVDTYLAQTLTSNNDTFFKSQYFYKDRDQKMISGPIWDTDLGFGTGWSSQISPNNDRLAGVIIAGDLFKHPLFKAKVKERYQQVYAPILDSLISTGEVMPTFEDSFRLIRSALAMDNILWRAKYQCGDGSLTWSDSTTPEDILQYRVDWITKHKAFLDTYFANMDIPESEIHLYGDPQPATATTHQRQCIYHAEEVLTGDCEYGAPKGNQNGTHTSLCAICGNEKTGSCDYNYADNGDGTHTKTCTICGETVAEGCVYRTPVDNGDGTHTKTCGLCGATISEDHVWSKGRTVRPATISAEGEMEQSCACGAVLKTPIPKLTEASVTFSKKMVTTADVKQIVARAQQSGGVATTVILGKNVKKIKAKAFRNTPVTTIIVKTKKLTKKSVKSSLKGSKVKTLQVKVGKKKMNKRYVKAYKKLFTKRNAGKKVKVKR